MMMSILALAGL